ncbi:MAG TPA: MFS transporter [Verrucomicrobiae bacterium]|nr:MFS transporter [Verrucomicrobiae bacterium]
MNTKNITFAAGDGNIAGFIQSEQKLYRKVTIRLIPFLFFCYILSYLARVNIGFAKLQMQQDLGMSDTVFGLGMGIFFVGYFFFEVPSNMILQRIGARLWIGPLMIVWGMVSCGFMFVKTPLVFYLLRFLLGVVESGFFPGVILYLTYWYPGRYRAQMVSAFMSAIALSGALGGPVAGWIMSGTSNLDGLNSWQWLLVIMGIPSIVVGIVAILYLDDGPWQAKWLQPAERELLMQRLAEDEAGKRSSNHSHHTFADAFRSPQVWLLCLVYFCVMMGNYYVGFWMPQLIKDSFSQIPWKIGLISAIPWGFAALTMIFWGHHSDVTGERRGHLAIALVVSAVFLILSGLHGMSQVLGVAVLALLTAGIMSSISTFWALPTGILSGSAAAAGIAWINSIGNLGGFVSPYVVGVIRDKTTNPIYPILVIAAACSMAAWLVMAVTRTSKLPMNH